MRKIFYMTFSITLLILTSCNNYKNYKYIEIAEEEGLSGRKSIVEKSEKTIRAVSDSAAYIAAFRDFMITKKIREDMFEAYGSTTSTPLRFKLFNSEGIDITNQVSFIDKEFLENKLKDEIFAKENSMLESRDRRLAEIEAERRQSIQIDSAKVLELERFFNVRVDEFLNNERKWHKPKSAPRYTNMNGIYLYFQTEMGLPSNLRFRVQYHANKWLFFSRVQFSIDGKAFEYTPNRVETDSGNGGQIWEWFDQQVSPRDIELLNALANANDAKIKFIGRQYHDIKTINREQILGIKRTLELYKAMGGDY